MAAAAKIEPARLRARQRERLARHPEAAHLRAGVGRDLHEELYARFAREPIVGALQIVVVEPELERLHVDVVRGAQCHHAEPAMRAGSVHDESRAAARDLGSAFRAHPLKAPDRSDLEEIVPAARDQRRDGHRFEVPLDVHLGPVVVVVRMREPLIVVRRERAVIREAFQRNLRDPVGEDPFLVPGQVLIGCLSRFVGRRGVRDQLTPICVGRKEAQGPALSKPQVEDAVHVRPLVVVIGRGHGGRNGDEMGWRCQRSLPLRHAEVRAAGHPDLAVGPRLGRGPLDGVVAVGLLLENGTEHALRSKRTADVLRQPDVAVLSPERH